MNMIREILRVFATVIRGWHLLVLFLSGVINFAIFVKTINKYNNKKELHPELAEKIRIERSKTPLMAENTKFEIGILIVTIVVVITNFYLISLYETNGNSIYLLIVISSFLSIILIFLYVLLTTRLSYFLFSIKFIRDKYGDTKRLKTPKCEYVIGTQEQIGNVRKNYKFNF